MHIREIKTPMSLIRLCIYLYPLQKAQFFPKYSFIILVSNAREGTVYGITKSCVASLEEVWFMYVINKTGFHSTVIYIK